LYPKRKYNVGHGVYPKKGWLKENQWEGWIPTTENPRLVNPAKGFIVSANNFVSTMNQSYGVSHQFSFQTRFVRITELLQEKIRLKGKVDLQDMANIFVDTLDV
jgi:penicillin amidase